MKFAHTLKCLPRVMQKICALALFCEILPIIAHFTFYFVQFANLHFFVYFLTNFVHFALVACQRVLHFSGEEAYKIFLKLLNVFVFRTSGSGVNCPKIPGGSTS